MPLIFGLVCALVAALPLAFAIVETTVPLALNALIQGWSADVPVPRLVFAPLCAAVVRTVAGSPSPSLFGPGSTAVVCEGAEGWGCPDQHALITPLQFRLL
ncbi:hypothetical protein [Deinococcus sp. QL22]|uniref:hypothetical protein n=1 Tax=Deinococcus sp. QL22 TaxID=2939437 RepID=UPI002016D447|nr:hypothetical protein [Deinococcus sp. QL22]UQN06530.1 hypothetical protein M1R55_01010 [Deinococcus sp. QL22]